MGTSWFLCVRLCDRVYNFFSLLSVHSFQSHYQQTDSRIIISTKISESSPLYTNFTVLTSRQIHVSESSQVHRYQSSPVHRYQSHYLLTDIRVIISRQISVSSPVDRYQNHHQCLDIRVITEVITRPIHRCQNHYQYTYYIMKQQHARPLHLAFSNKLYICTLTCSWEFKPDKKNAPKES